MKNYLVALVLAFVATAGVASAGAAETPELGTEEPTRAPCFLLYPPPEWEQCFGEVGEAAGCSWSAIFRVDGFEAVDCVRELV